MVLSNTAPTRRPYTRLGIMGGTFDPIHFGHLCCAEQVKSACGLDAVLFLPAGNPVFKLNQDVTPGADRLAMCQLALASNQDFFLSSMEIDREGVTYTVDTLCELRTLYGPDTELCWIMGADAAAGLPLWKDVERIAAMATILLVDRPGSEAALRLLPHLAGIGDMTIDIVQTTLLDISSTDIRNRVRGGQTIRYLVPDDVRDYILDHQLYLGNTDESFL